jgi:hypothetical protein
MKSAKMLVLFCIAAAVAAAASAAQPDVPADSSAVVGSYKGKLTFTKGGKGMDDYDYTIEVFPSRSQPGKIAIRATSDFYASKEIKLGNCEPVDGKPAAFVCKGKDGWHEDFEVTGSTLKGSGVTRKNLPYFINATKVTKTAE